MKKQYNDHSNTIINLREVTDITLDLERPVYQILVRSNDRGFTILNYGQSSVECMKDYFDILKNIA